MTVPALAQLQWRSYNNAGVLLTSNVASGGDTPYGGSVTFTIPGSSERIFTTETFAPVSIAAASSSEKINFSMAATGGLYPGSTGRIIGMGLLNDPGTPSSSPFILADTNAAAPSAQFYRIVTGPPLP
jgi:hypothetical protein